MSKNIMRTVCGDITPESLGYCQSHEHLLIRKCKSYHVNKALYMDETNRSIEELKSYYVAGGRALVDAQPVGAGRMASGLYEIAEASQVKIIGSTGFHKLIFYPDDHWIHHLSQQELASIYIQELTEGMYDDGEYGLPTKKLSYRAGIIKTALDTCNLTDTYRKLFQGAAIGSIETGASLMIHVEKGSDPMALISFLTTIGVKTQHIILCHMDRARYDIDYHKQLLNQGVYLEYDTIGRYKYHSDDQEIELIKAMVEAGYEKQLLLGLDTTRQRLHNYGGSIGLDYILTNFINQMLNKGISQYNIDKFMIHNPKEALSLH